MEAKDTVMDSKMREHLLQDWKHNLFNDSQDDLVANVILDTAYIQAEISFKAGKQEGRKEVVKWLQDRWKSTLHAPFFYTSLGDDTGIMQIQISQGQWQAYLKTLGL